MKALHALCVAALCAGLAALPPAAAAAADPGIAVTGSAVFLAPGTFEYEGVFTEHCVGHSAIMHVHLAWPHLLQGSQFIQLGEGSYYVPTMRVNANQEGPEISGFYGTGPCVPAGTPVYIFFNLGTLGGGLDKLLGSGKVTATPNP